MACGANVVMRSQACVWSQLLGSFALFASEPTHSIDQVDKALKVRRMWRNMSHAKRICCGLHDALSHTLCARLSTNLHETFTVFGASSIQLIYRIDKAREWP